MSQVLRQVGPDLPAAVPSWEEGVGTEGMGGGGWVWGGGGGQMEAAQIPRKKRTKNAWSMRKTHFFDLHAGSPPRASEQGRKAGTILCLCLDLQLLPRKHEIGHKVWTVRALEGIFSLRIVARLCQAIV